MTSAGEATKAVSDYYSAHAHGYEELSALPLLQANQRLVTRVPLGSARIAAIVESKQLISRPEHSGRVGRGAVGH